MTVYNVYVKFEIVADSIEQAEELLTEDIDHLDTFVEITETRNKEVD